jgi:hypothetical protein
VIGRLEVLPGAGTAARFDEIALWAGVGASRELLAFLIDSAKNLGSLADGGARIADHLGAVLSDRRPEPNTPFVTVGPGAESPVALLHGPVQMWDGARWIRPDIATGWIRVEVPNLATVLVTPIETPAPPSANPVLDLLAGIVPGGGLAVVLTAAPPVAPAPEPEVLVPEPVVEPAELELKLEPGYTLVESVLVEPEPVEPDLVEPDLVEPEPAPAATVPEPPELSFSPPPVVEPSAAVFEPVRAPEPPAPPTRAEAEPAQNGRLGTIDLRALPASNRPPLPPTDQVDGDLPGSVRVQGLRCPSGHFNYGGAATCLRCGLPLDPSRGLTSGPRPPLGVLISTDGSLWRLDASYLIGTDPSSDPAVATGAARGLWVVDDGQADPVHAELRATDWTLSVVDRHTRAGTFVLPPGTADWQRVAADQAVAVKPGTHVAVGSTVFTFTSPWPL